MRKPSTNRAAFCVIRSCIVLSCIVLAGLAAIPTVARAQGTEEQTEACSGDAFTLCRSEIPNVAKITACMRVHRSELSPKCRAVFDSSDAPKAAPPKVEPTKAAAPHAAATKPPAPKEAKAKDAAKKDAMNKGVMAKGAKSKEAKSKEAKGLKSPKVAAPKAAGRKVVGPQTAKMPVVPRRHLKPAPVPTAQPETPAPAAAPPPAPAPSSTPGLDSYRASITRSCEQGLIDAYTCKSTLKLLDGM